jgi:AcrR family transcriptional regulator
MSLRKEKSARLKVHILEQALKLVARRPFEDLYVDELCARVKISKVTFFKYFPQKEDLLLYYFRMWCFDRSVDVHEKPREGMAGIYFLSDKLSEAYEEHPGMVLSLIGYLADFKRPPKPFPIKPEEKHYRYPENEAAPRQEILSLEQLLEKFVLEAIFRKEITRTSSTREVTNVLLSLLFGSLVSSHTQQITPAKYYLKKNIDLLLKGLQ